MDWVPPLDIERRSLTNGLRVVLCPDPWLPLVSINLWYHVGSKHERPGRTGFAHLFEHMLFQGSENVPANGHFGYVQQVGGVANGSTWYDRTSYYETLPAHHLELGLWLESDRMGFLLPALTEEKLENQREVVMNERRERVDNRPYGLAMERLFGNLYPEEHPYHWPVIGYMDDIAAATLDNVREFFATYYVPNNAVLTLAGDFETDRAMELIHKHFAPIPGGPPVAPVETGLPRQPGPKREVLPDSVELPRIYRAFTLPAYGTPDWYAADLLSVVLTEGKSSVLHTDLVYRRQIAHSLSSMVLTTENCATLVLAVTARPGTDPDVLEEALREHLQTMAQEPVEASQLERAKNSRVTAYYGELQRLDRKADRLSHLTTFFDDPQRLASEGATYRKIQAEDLQRLVQQYCTDRQSATVVVLPRKSNG